MRMGPSNVWQLRGTQRGGPTLTGPTVACCLMLARSPAVRLDAGDAPFLRDLPLHLAALYPGFQYRAWAAAPQQLARGGAPLNPEAARMRELARERERRERSQQGEQLRRQLP